MSLSGHDHDVGAGAGSAALPSTLRDCPESRWDLVHDDVPMSEREEQARRRDEENREELAMRKQERQLAAGERELEREQLAFQQAEKETKENIEHEWRNEHFGHEPERPPAWRPDGPEDHSGSTP
jgi:hypothetical protein